MGYSCDREDPGPSQAWMEGGWTSRPAQEQEQRGRARVYTVPRLDAALLVGPVRRLCRQDGMLQISHADDLLPDVAPRIPPQTGSKEGYVRTLLSLPPRGV